MFLNKKLCANGISLRVEIRIALLNEEHLVNKTVIFALALFLECGIGFLQGGLYPHRLSKCLPIAEFYVQQFLPNSMFFF